MSKSKELLINSYPVRVNLMQGRTKPRVACLGPEGTYTEAARQQLLGNYLHEMDVDFLPYNATVVQRVDAEDCDIGIVPVENAIEGDVTEVLRELNHAKNLNIIGETILGIEHMLIGRSPVDIDEIRSHPQALGQCSIFLAKRYPTVQQEPSSSTSEAVKAVLDNKRIAAIASKRAAEIYDLPIIAEDIGNVKGNSTRFLMLGRGETFPTGQDSTAFVFVPTGDRPGILARCLTTLASYGINLTKLDSRPTGTMREYAFWVTIDGHYQDEKVKKGLDDLRQTYCSSLHLFGSYRKAVLPKGVKEPGSLNGQGNAMLTH